MLMVKNKKQPSVLRSWRLLATCFLLVVAGIVLWVNGDKFASSLRVLDDISLWYVTAAVGLTGITLTIAAGIYMLLALKPLRYAETLLIELAASCINRLLPAGIASLGLHGRYLYKKKHSVPQATAVISVNNLIGMVAHLTILAGVIIVSPSVITQLSFGRVSVPLFWVVAVVGLTVLAVVLSPSIRKRVVTFVRNLLQSFRLIAKRPGRLAGAFGLAMLLTLSYVAVLYVLAWAVGLELGFWPCFVVFSAGMLVGTATPTPGGLVGAEAGLFAAFVAYGATAPLAGATVLLFRLATYWLPIIPGALALFVARKQRLI